MLLVFLIKLIWPFIREVLTVVFVATGIYLITKAIYF